MHLEPLHLRTFNTLVSEGSVTRASLELRTSASNVRRIWQNLEEQLGEKLFIPNEQGETIPTPAARILDREMNGLLEEVRRFEASVKRIHRTGRTLRLGANRTVFNTSHFGRLFNTLRHDERFRISFVEIKGDEGRAALETGGCDLVFGVDGTPGRRFESRDLPPLTLDVAYERSPQAEEKIHPSQLADLQWSLATFAKTSLALDTLRKIENSGGGSGRLCSQHQFLSWAEDTPDESTEAVVCIRPASFSRLPRVSFLPLDLNTGYPLCVSYLRQHPYEFLPSIVEQMNRALGEPPHGSRPSLS